MSNYVLLIMHEYFEKLKLTKDIKMLGTKEIVKESWLAIVLFAITVVSLILLFRSNVDYFGWIFLCFTISVLSLIPITQNISQKTYERSKEVYNVKIKMFRKILSEFGFYDLKRIQGLIEQCDLSCVEYKLSKKISNPVTNISKSIFLPLLTFASGLMVKNISVTLAEATKYTIYIVLGIILLLIFVYEIKWILEEFLDNESKKLHTIKGLLIDISIKDFIKEYNYEKFDDNCCL